MFAGSADPLSAKKAIKLRKYSIRAFFFEREAWFMRSKWKEELYFFNVGRRRNVRTLGDSIEYFLMESKFYWPVILLGIPAIGALLVGNALRWEHASTSVTNRVAADTISIPARSSNEPMIRCDLPGGGCYRCCP
jgi:hypothetical protein